ncbi:Hsp70 protein-domain-containing protein [Lentinula edodes]|nr:Hsp70 protein-domain-containing protein [Lentinula edodes]
MFSVSSMTLLLLLWATVSPRPIFQKPTTPNMFAYDRNLGSCDIDYALVKHFAAEFKEKYKIDVLSNPKAVFQLAAITEKLKKVLSANAEAPIDVESIMNDIDASSKLTRDDLEGLIADELSCIVAPIQRAIDNSGLNLDEIEVVELIGGSSRIPAVRARIAECFPGKTLSTTLNQDEAVARGATFSCAMLSPVFRVREFSVSDINAYLIKVQWAPVPSDPEEDTELVVFGKGNTMPSTKILSFYMYGAAIHHFPQISNFGNHIVNPWALYSGARHALVPTSLLLPDLLQDTSSILADPTGTPSAGQEHIPGMGLKPKGYS